MAAGIMPVRGIVFAVENMLDPIVGELDGAAPFTAEQLPHARVGR